MLNKITNRILSFFFPDRCIICGRVLSFRPDELCFCDTCSKRLTFLQNEVTCHICGRPVYGGERLCETCLTHRHAFDRAISCLVYTGAAREAVLAFKFGDRRDYCRTFAAMMYRTLQATCRSTDFDMIVCAPLSKASYKRRGYNQAALLARHLSGKTKLPFCAKAFVKIKDTPAQSSLQHYVDRIENVRGAFRLHLPAEAFCERRILLVDDVLTTGATADALSALLKRAGAKSVTVITVASPERNRLEKLPQPDLDEDEF